jgi:hypothetical protein
MNVETTGGGGLFQVLPNRESGERDVKILAIEYINRTRQLRKF